MKIKIIVNYYDFAARLENTASFQKRLVRIRQMFQY